MSEEDDTLSDELDEALRQAGIGDGDADDASKSPVQMEQDLSKANTMLQQALRQKKDADTSRKSAVEKANSMRAFQVESLEKNRKKIDSLQERLDVAEAAIEPLVKDREEAEKVKQQAEAEVARLKEQVMQAMHKSNEEISRLQDELMLATAQQDSSGDVEKEARSQGMSEDDIDLLEQLRIARTLESDSTASGSMSDAPADFEKPKPQIVKGIVLLTLVGSATTIFAYKDAPSMAPVMAVIGKVQEAIGSLIAQIVALI